jgi:hypothetical protein
MRGSAATLNPVTPVPSASRELFQEAEAWKTTPPERHHNIVLVVVESWGLLRRPASNDLLTARFHAPHLQEGYEMREGTVPFEGATTAGEFRELCGVFRSHSNAPDSAQPGCLPAKLRAAGFRTLAIHGFQPGFFDRRRWYPLLGFDEMLFAPELVARGVKGNCGIIFVGACDADVARLIDSTLADVGNARPLFVYWLTLNSHLPLSASTAAASHFDCRLAPEAAEIENICLWMRMMDVVLSSMAAIATDPHIPPTRFLIVGDHSTPFAAARTRDMFVQDRVPFIELVPRRPPAGSR